MPSNRVILTPLFLDKPVPALTALAKPGWVINDPPLPAGELPSRLAPVHEALADFVAATFAAKQRPVSIAGDCCTAIGVTAGLQRAGVNPTLIWLDAHGDFNTPETTPSGFLGGMPLAMLVGRGDLCMPAAVGLKPLPEDRVILTDGRDLDPGERELLAHSQVIHLEDAAALGAHVLPDGPLYVHFDADVVAQDESPAQNYPAGGGPSAAELNTVFESLALTDRLAAVSICTWNPELDRDGRSRQTSMRLLKTLVGAV